MKKFYVILLVVMFATSATFAFASSNDAKGSAKAAQSQSSDEDLLGKIGDWFATVGKSEEEKTKILMERKAERMKKKLEKEAAKAQSKATKDLKKATQKGS